MRALGRLMGGRPIAEHGMGLLARHPGQLRIDGLTRRDARRLGAHLLRLPPEDRRARFHGAMSDMAINAYVRRIDWPNDYIFGISVAGELRGVAELVPLEGSAEAEVALSVEPQYQHAGLGKLLILSTMLAARRLGLSRIVLTLQRGNTGMVALARDMGANLTQRDGVPAAVITVPQVTTTPGTHENSGE